MIFLRQTRPTSLQSFESMTIPEKSLAAAVRDFPTFNDIIKFLHIYNCWRSLLAEGSLLSGFRRFHRAGMAAKIRLKRRTVKGFPVPAQLAAEGQQIVRGSLIKKDQIHLARPTAV